MKLGNFDLNRLLRLETTLKSLSSTLYSILSIEEWQEEYWDRKIGLMLEKNLEKTQYNVDIDRIANIFHNKYSDPLNRIYETLHKEYDPLSNTDATTDITSTDTYDTQNNIHENSETNRAGTVLSNTNSEINSSDAFNQDSTDNSTNTLKNSGYNNNDLTVTNQTQYADGKHSDSTSSNNTNDITTSVSNNEDVTESDTNRISADTGTVTHETLLKRFGNVGVTTNQKMVEDEILIRIRFNYLEILYKMLAEFLLDKIWEV